MVVVVALKLWVLFESRGSGWVAFVVGSNKMSVQGIHDLDFNL